MNQRSHHSLYAHVSYFKQLPVFKTLNLIPTEDTLGKLNTQKRVAQGGFNMSVLTAGHYFNVVLDLNARYNVLRPVRVGYGGCVLNRLPRRK
jgi:hypothetical protein